MKIGVFERREGGNMTDLPKASDGSSPTITIREFLLYIAGGIAILGGGAFLVCRFYLNEMHYDDILFFCVLGAFFGLMSALDKQEERESTKRGQLPASAPKRKEPRSYGASIGLWAGGLGIAVTCITIAGKGWPPQDAQIRVIVFAILLGALIGTVTATARKKGFPLRDFLWGMLISVAGGACLPVLFIVLVNGSAWLFAQPRPITDISWKWYVSSGIFWFAFYVIGTIAKPREASSYARQAVCGGVFGTMMVLILIIATSKQVEPTVPAIVSTFVLAVILGGLPLALVLVLTFAEDRGEYPILRMINAGLTGVVIGLVIGLAASFILAAGFHVPVFADQTWIYMTGGSAGISLVISLLRCMARISRRGSNIGSVLAGAGKFNTEIGTGLSQVVGFVKGMFWLVLAGCLCVGAWQLPSPFSFVALGFGAVAGLKGFWEFGMSLTPSREITSKGPHGASRLATKKEAERAARGEPDPDGPPSPPDSDLNY
jgi:hypothetical protein